MIFAAPDRRALALLVLVGIGLGGSAWLLPASQYIVAWLDDAAARVSLVAPPYLRVGDQNA
jgi:hypothetical protein